MCLGLSRRLASVDFATRTGAEAKGASAVVQDGARRVLGWDGAPPKQGLAKQEKDSEPLKTTFHADFLF